MCALKKLRSKFYVGLVLSASVCVLMAGCGRIWGGLTYFSSPPVGQCTNKQISSWTFDDGGAVTGLNYIVGHNAFEPSATIFGNDLFLAWSEISGGGSYQVRVKYFDGATFFNGDGGTGINYFAGNNSQWPAIFAFGPTMLVNFGAEDCGPYCGRAKIYAGGTNWNGADSGGTIDAPQAGAFIPGGQTQNASQFSLAYLNGLFYSVFAEAESAPFVGDQIRSIVYNGGTSWSLIDGGGNAGLNFNPNDAGGDPAMVAFNNELYASWYEACPGPIYCIRASAYNGTSWASVDGATANGNISRARRSYEPALFVFNNKLYAAWQEYDASNIFQIRVKVYNGNDSSPAWTAVDGNGPEGLNRNSAFDGQAPKFAVFNCQLYLTWYESNGSNTEIRVAVYNGNDGSPSWSFVDGGNSSAGINQTSTNNGQGPLLVVFNNLLYAMWVEANGANGQIRLAHGQ